MFCKRDYFSILIIVACVVVQYESARILAVFPTPSISHQVVFRPLTQELAKRGHEVVVLTPDPAFSKGQTPGNLTEIDFHDKSYEWWGEHFVKNVDGDSTSAYEVMKIAFNSLREIFEMQVQTEEMQNIIHSGQRFDLVMVEACVRPALVMGHVFKAPVIQVSSLGAIPPNYQMFGAPSHPILYPELTRQRLYNLTLFEKVQGTFEDFRFRRLIWMMEGQENSMLRRNFGPDTPTVEDLSSNVDLLVLNINPIWEGNRPVPPNVIYMGGLHQKPQKDLPTDLKNYLDNSKKGVIYMSFGTNVSPSQLPAERIQLFNKVFSKLPYNVLWKWDKDIMPGKAKNVRISKWLPQSDLLRHPNIKLFITQAGLQSTDEAITAGVPLIAFPMLGDQWYNAENYIKHKIGLKFDLTDITEEILEKSIQSVIADRSYHNNIVRLRILMQDQPQKPLDRAVWWIEYVIRHKGAKHLRSPAANISWAEYLMLDVVATLCLAMAMIIYIIFKLINLYFSSFSEKKICKTD